ncbi:5-oxoprolinase subunit C [Paenibacillus plantiphilus]|uniref:5-oxoprolinase subunit C n=2 Tax=Paenibacillus plantiphilus TaxID=2905650 RepID=A0ABN8GL41_9BACL|nr:5-oxoprolinase subunit C [Paenibacillus plantiphilus]
MSLIILKPGFFTTVQDLGRNGWRKDGLPAGGAMDRYALRTANLLVGNDEGAAGLELTLVGPTFTTERDMLLAICGAYMSPQMDDGELPMWRPVWVAAGSRITFGAASAGCRAYIAVAGGIDAAAVLGSRSTDVRARIGGVDGRPLQAGDALPCGERGSDSGARAAWARLWRAGLAARAAAEPRGRDGFAAPGWFAPPLAYGGGAADGIELRAMPGSEFGRLSAAARTAFFTERFNVAPASDRMGVRLAGPPLEQRYSTELLSHGVVPGTVQLPYGGNPIVLAADCQTTGGYPKIAHVIAADLPLLAQARPGAAIFFREVALAEAQRIELAFEREMRHLAAGIRCQLP